METKMDKTSKANGNTALHPDVERVILTEEEIKEKVKEVAKKIDLEYKDKNLLLVCVLKGSVVFFSDLMRSLEIPAKIDFIRASSYGASAVSSGDLKFTLKLCEDGLCDADILIVEDIIDTGHTLKKVTDYYKKIAKSVKTCAFLDKPERREADIEADFYGVRIPNEFVIGYGLDYAEDYRTLPYVGVLKREVYE